jgi:hypothetical protein
MIYETRLTIPKNTPRTAMVTADILVNPGTVQLVEVEFPNGCCGLAHVVIYYLERQVWPSNPDSDFHGDGVTLSYPENVQLVDPPFIFTARGWSDDDTYPHTPTVRLAVIPFGGTVQDMLAALLVGPSGPVTVPGG